MSAIAQTQQAISRAVAQFAAHGLLPARDMASVFDSLEVAGLSVGKFRA